MKEWINKKVKTFTLNKIICYNISKNNSSVNEKKKYFL